MIHREKPLQKPDGSPYVFDSPKNRQRFTRGFLIVCIILVLLDFSGVRHADHPWEALFSFYPLYGFVSCVVLVLLAKKLRQVIMRQEAYYEPYPGPETRKDVEPSEQEGSDA